MALPKKPPARKFTVADLLAGYLRRPVPPRAWEWEYLIKAHGIALLTLEGNTK